MAWARSGHDPGQHPRLRCRGGNISGDHCLLSRVVPGVDGGLQPDHSPKRRDVADRHVGVTALAGEGLQQDRVNVKDRDLPAGLAEQLADEPAAHTARAENDSQLHHRALRIPPRRIAPGKGRCRR